MKIDYTYTHDKTCELFVWLKGFLKPENCDAVFEQLQSAMRDVAFHEAERYSNPNNRQSEEKC